MKVSIELKHLIIVGIVVIYTFTSIIFDLTGQLYNPTLNIAFIYNSSDLNEGSDSEQIWEALNAIKENSADSMKDSRFETVELENANIQAALTDQINEYARNNEVVVIEGSSYNEEIETVIRENPSTQFLLIDSKFGQSFPNLAKIDVEDTARVKKLAKNIALKTKTDKVLYLGTELDYSLNYDTFADEVLKYNNKATITSIVVDDKVDKVEIKKQLMKSFSDGYDSIYVANRNLNKIAIETAKDVQDEIISDRVTVDEQLKAIKENKNTVSADDQTTDETTSDEQTSDESTSDEQTSNEVVTDEDGTPIDDTKQDVEATTQEVVEMPTYKYEQKQIHLFVNSDDSLDAGIYFSDETNADVKSVVDGYIDINYEEVLNRYFKQIIKGNQINKSDELTFDNEGLELIKE